MRAKCSHKNSILVLAIALCLGCKPASDPTPPISESKGPLRAHDGDRAKEFEILLKRCVIPPEDDRFGFPRKDDDRLVELACSSADLYDRMLEKLVDLPEDSFPSPCFGRDYKFKACQLGELYTHGLVARLLSERRPRHRALLREAIEFHAVHDHAAVSGRAPYDQSVAGKLKAFTPVDRQEARWQIVVQAIYSKWCPEALSEVWTHIRADDEMPVGSRSLSGLSMLLELSQFDRGEFRRHVLDGCRELVTRGMELENPHAAGWLVTSGLGMYRSVIMAEEAARFESLLSEAASNARSQTFRGQAVHGLIIMRSARSGEKLNQWLQGNPTAKVVTEALRALRHSVHDPSLWDSIAKEVVHPRTRAWCTVRREVQTRERKIGQVVEPYLLDTLRTDKEAEMRRAALEELVARIRNDVATGKAELLKVMEQAKAIVPLVAKDSSIEVRWVLVEALKPYEEYFGFLDSDLQDELRRLFDPLK